MNEFKNSFFEGKEQSVVLTSEEMSQLFNEWTKIGKLDLEIDPELGKKVIAYLKYQNTLDSYRKDLASRICKPYSFNLNMKKKKFKSVKLYIDGESIGVMLSLYMYEGQYRMVSFNDFRTVLMAMGSEYAKWIPTNSICSDYIDLVAYVLDHKGRLLLYKWSDRVEIYFDLDKIEKDDDES